MSDGDGIVFIDAVRALVRELEHEGESISEGIVFVDGEYMEYMRPEETGSLRPRSARVGRGPGASTLR